jgi:hypothetical protein
LKSECIVRAAGTPADHRPPCRGNAEMAKDLAHQKRMTDIGSIAIANSPRFQQNAVRETDQWAKALKAIGLAK